MGFRWDDGTAYIFWPGHWCLILRFPAIRWVKA